jgi:hypothetical protein
MPSQVEPRLCGVKEAGENASRKQARRGAITAIAVILTAVVVAVLALMSVSGSEDASGAIDAVTEATAPMLDDYRSNAEAAGGTLTVTWSSSPMSGGQMVEARIESAVPEYRGKAVFMVEDGGGRITAQDGYAASLLGRAAAPHK